jgi:signal transduction histidine kinase/CHASE2 domain-containing sensor protein
VLLAVLLKLGLFYPLEQIAYNSLFRLRGEQSWDDRLVLITIDDASIEQIGLFPWPRRQYVKLLQMLTQAQPSVIGLDLIFSEPSVDDDQLAKVMGDYGRVVLAKVYNRAEIPLRPVPNLLDAAIATGHVVHDQDTDGVTRRVPLYVKNTPVLGLATLQVHALVRENVSLDGLQPVLWINWSGSVQRIPQYSFVDVVQGKIPIDRFRDKIVLVGATAVGMDPLVTPYNRNPEASGLHLHVAIIDTLLKQKALQPLSSYWLWVVLLGAGPVFSCLLSRQPGKWAFVVGLAANLGWTVFAIWMFSLNYWIPVAMPICLFTLTSMATALSRRLKTDELLRQQMQRLWQAYQKDLVIRSSNSSSEEIENSNSWLDSIQSAHQLALLADQFGRSQATQASIARSLPIALLAIDLDGRVWFCNPVATEWLQVQTGDSLLPNLIPQWISQAAWQSDIKTLQQQGDVAARTLQSGDRWFELKLESLITPPPDKNSQADNYLDGFLVVLADVTTQKQAEAALATQVQELQQLSQLKDDFLSMVSHELRAPMANIQMAIELLKISQAPDRIAHYLKILQHECRREVELINDLLDLQRLEAGSQTFSPEKIDLQNWLPPIIEPFYERAQAQGQIFQVNLAPHLPCLISDQNSLERILAELINNACKYTPPDGKIQVMANFTPSYLEFKVINWGTQIPKTELPKIFDKFYRVPQADPWKRGGTGLGLALVKRLVEYLGGGIQVESESGQTMFTVQLPLALKEGEWGVGSREDGEGFSGSQSPAGNA